MAREFPTALASRVTDASIRCLDMWARTNLLTPSGQNARGKGSRRSYTFQDLVSIRTIVDLRARKCPLQQVRAAVAELQKLFPELTNSQTLARLTLLTDGKRVYILTDESQAMDVLTRQTVWAVPLGRHMIETAERVERLPREWTELATMGGRSFHIHVKGEDSGKKFTAHCREMPGTLEHGTTAEEAIGKVKESVQRVRAYFDKQTDTGTARRRRASH